MSQISVAQYFLVIVSR